MNLFASLFASKRPISSHARELALEGARQRRMSERERKIARLNQMRRELGMQPYETAR
jgi:hypothetical protein